MGILITFEGGEGSGKSYQAKIFYKRLKEMAIPAILTHEPGGTPVGDKITRILKWGKSEYLSPLTELMLFNSSRAHLIDKIIKPNLYGGKIVICDRFTDSTVAYQGYGRGLDLSIVNMINNTASCGIKPKLTVLLDLPVENGLKRKSKTKPDRFHMEDLEFHMKVRRGFLELVEREPDRWLVIDALQSRVKIANIIWQKASRYLTDWNS